MDIKFARFDYKEELKIQRKLFKECFPETIDTAKVSVEHYIWKFHRKEMENPSSEYGAYLNKDLVGYYAAIPYKYKTDSRVLNAAMVCDVMTGVKARGKGVFTKLGLYATNELAKEGYDITTGYPIRKEVIPGHIKAGWEKNIELPLYVRFIKFNSFLKSKKIGFLVPFFNVLMSTYSSVLMLLSPNNKSLKVEFYESKDLLNIEGLTDFYEKWANQVPISLLKNNDFLTWRLGAPKTRYHIIVLRRKLDLVGVLIGRVIIREGVPCFGILDLSMLKEYYKYSKYLIRSSVIIAKKNNLEMILVMISNFWYGKYKLILNSFIKTPYKFYLIVKKLNKKIPDNLIKDKQNWHVMWIDSDDL